MMKVGQLTVFIVCCAKLALAGPATKLSAYCPKWTVGDWWTVDSQVYDRAENLPGGVPHWLDAETWKFSVDGTNAVDGQACYAVSVRPAAQNRCPYWFTYSFRQSDLLVMNRQLHQPAFGKSGQSGGPVVESTFSKDEEAPFVQSDFPNVPVTMPHFGGAATNAYRSAALAGKNLNARTNLQVRSRVFTGTMSQSVDSQDRLPTEFPSGKRSARVLAGNQATNSVAVKISLSNDKQENQRWSAGLPWPVYSEKREYGELVRKSWLTDFGHSTPDAGATGGRQ